jgi:hypothetical protein
MLRKVRTMQIVPRDHQSSGKTGTPGRGESRCTALELSHQARRRWPRHYEARDIEIALRQAAAWISCSNKNLEPHFGAAPRSYQHHVPNKAVNAVSLNS